MTSTIPATTVIDRSAPETAPGTALGEIDIDELEEDRRDDDWQEFLQASVAYRSRLRLENRIS